MLAVKLYETMPSNDENVLLGIDTKIPAKVVDLDKFPNYEIDETYELMTQEEYNTYNGSLESEYSAWEVIQNSIIQVMEEVYE